MYSCEIDASALVLLSEYGAVSDCVAGPAQSCRCHPVLLMTEVIGSDASGEHDYPACLAVAE